MTLRKTNAHSNVVAAQIIRVNSRSVTVRTEDGQQLTIPLSKQYRRDQARIASLQDIRRNKIWIPVNKRLHSLFTTDWLVTPQPVLARSY